MNGFRQSHVVRRAARVDRRDDLNWSTWSRAVADRGSGMLAPIPDELEVILGEIEAVLRDLDAELRRAVHDAGMRVGRWLYKFGMRAQGREPEDDWS
jgi:hypothetical protein